MKKTSLILSVLFFFSFAIFAQTQPPSNLSGQELKTWLKTNWFDGKHIALTYTGAKSIMYDYIDIRPDGKVHCVYSGSIGSINCEHTIPQSFFGEALPMKSDIFHLYPTNSSVNSARGHLPFAEIPDDQTNKWYSTNTSSAMTTITTKPTSDIDSYSELITSKSFEPREDHKGDVARSAFYFYTMYPTQAGDISKLCNLATLLAWNEADPVDAWELQRNSRTAEKQGNRNPYIDYPELANRAWKVVTDVKDLEKAQSDKRIYPNPVSDKLNIEQLSGESIIVIYNPMGQKIYTQSVSNTKAEINTVNYAPGIYFMQIYKKQKLIQISKFVKK